MTVGGWDSRDVREPWSTSFWRRPESIFERCRQHDTKWILDHFARRAVQNDGWGGGITAGVREPWSTSFWRRPESIFERRRQHAKKWILDHFARRAVQNDGSGSV
jgi:hypothetical protein